MAKISVCGVLRPNYCGVACLLHAAYECALLLLVTCALDGLAVERTCQATELVRNCMHKNGENRTSSSEDMIVDKHTHTHTQTDTLITILRCSKHLHAVYASIASKSGALNHACG